MTQMTSPDYRWCFSNPIETAFGRHSFSTIRGGLARRSLGEGERPRLHPSPSHSCPFVSIRGSPARVGPRAQQTKGPRDRIRVNPRPSVVTTPRSDTGAHHDHPSLEQKTGKFGKAYRRFLIRDTSEIRGQSRGAIRKRLRLYGRRHRPGSPDPGYK